MKLVFEPLVTTLLTSFLLFLIACFLFLNSKRILTIGYHTLTIVCVLSILRLLFPFEFSFTPNIYLNEMPARISGFFCEKHMFFPNITVSFLHFLAHFQFTPSIIYYFYFFHLCE